MEPRLSSGGLGAGLTYRWLSRVAIAPRAAEGRCIVTEAERQVADLLPIEVDPDVARATVEQVPFWFHTFALNGAEGVYTPGAARDHRYRVSTLPSDIAGMSVLDVGTFDGFYAFLAEHRGARRVVAIDNEQYRLWVAPRWGVELQAARASARSSVCSARPSSIGAWTRSSSTGSASASTSCTALASCTGSRTRSGCCVCCVRGRARRNGAARSLRPRRGDRDGPSIRVTQPGEVYACDEFVYWGFGHTALERLGRIAGFSRAAWFETVEVDGHPRIIGWLVA